METVMSKKAVAVLSPESVYDSVLTLGLQQQKRGQYINIS
jgi:hypothetical protein